MVLLLMLRAWKMNPTDVQAIQVGSSPAMMAALEKGGIDAAVLTEPTFFMAGDLGYQVLADLADMDIYYLHSMIDTTPLLLAFTPGSRYSLHQSVCRGNCLFQEEPARIGRGHEEETSHCAGQTKYLERSHATYASGYFENAPYPSVKGASSVLEFLSRDNPRARTADPNQSSTPLSSRNWTIPALSRSSTNRR